MLDVPVDNKLHAQQSPTKGVVPCCPKQLGRCHVNQIWAGCKVCAFCVPDCGDCLNFYRRVPSSKVKAQKDAILIPDFVLKTRHTSRDDWVITCKAVMKFGYLNSMHDKNCTELFEEMTTELWTLSFFSVFFSAEFLKGQRRFSVRYFVTAVVLVCKILLLQWWPTRTRAKEPFWSKSNIDIMSVSSRNNMLHPNNKKRKWIRPHGNDLRCAARPVTHTGKRER